MFIRDPWTTDTVQQAGPWNSLGRRGLGAVPGASDQALLRELHGLALAMYQAKQDIQAAQGRGDGDYVTARVQDLARLNETFKSTAEQYVGNDPEALTLFDRIYLAVGTFIGGVATTISGAVTAIPGGFIDAVTSLGRKAESGLFALTLPLLAVGAGLIWLVLQGVGKAERTRTYKRYVA
jgi:hypothetical protein